MNSSPVSDRIPTLADIRSAAARLDGKSVVTPLVADARLSAAVGGRVLVKAECLQRTGSFKFRGAYNKLSRLDEKTAARGVVAFSSGNHAQGVAAAAQLLGIDATIVMPADAPAIKIANTKSYGAKVVPYDRQTEDRAAIARKIASESGATLVPPFDDPQIVAGQGTVGLEIVEQCAALGVAPDIVLVPCSGGGLSAGITLALATLTPSAKVHTVEPAGFDDTARSLAAGERVRHRNLETGLCDALLSPSPGVLPFQILRRHAGSGFVVTDDAVLDAMAHAMRNLHIVVEPGGAVALAALVRHKAKLKGKTIVAVASGGNADPAALKKALGQTTD